LDKASVINCEVENAIDILSVAGKKFDLIFLDPPYGKNYIGETLKKIAKNDIIGNNGIIIAERDIGDEIPESVEFLSLSRNQRYGDTILSFYTR
jgi:16S rRNA G966 N2-methylase RsmD